MSADTNEAMRRRSGTITSDSQLEVFLYLLMRDKLPLGTVEEMVMEAEESNPGSRFTNGWLAEYARDLALRLQAE